MKKKHSYKNITLKDIISEFANVHNLKVLMHFPHSSLDVPDSFWEDVQINNDYFNHINLLMSDVLLLEYFKDWDYEKIIAPYSRLYVDVEKYWDHEKELMAKYGMGAIYTKDLYGNDLHIKSDNFIKEAKSYYDNHHERLSKACDCEQDILIIDIHSFNDKMSSLFNKRRHLPDVCIGVNNDDSRNNDLLNEIKLWDKANHSFKYKINYPYSGSILPNYRNGKNKIYSIMFEFNKRWYL
ncbi:MAG: N-formylglutamate amidohydrolase [Bacilli bacterium]